MQRLANERGQTLVEALLAVAFAVVVVVALVGVGITAMRTADYGKNQAEATRLSTEALELLRNQRDGGWANFLAVAQNCVNPPNTGCCLPQSNVLSMTATQTPLSCLVASGGYNRYVVPVISASSIVYTVHTSYIEGSVSRDVSLTQTFTNWH
ncbi:MAG: hypothetical protein NT141_00445 [candidate division WWE3 bacterium]|nr:hypothetical protein [candidate division WWE3 bacterium]